MKKTEIIETTYELDNVKIKEEPKRQGQYTILLSIPNLIHTEMMCGVSDNDLVTLKYLIQEIIDDKKKNNGDIL